MYVIGAIWLHSGTRRRYGSYRQEDGNCEYEPESVVEQACYQHIAQGASDFNSSVNTQYASIDCSFSNTAACCHKCGTCEDEYCMDSISGCADFQSAIVKQCTEQDGGVDTGLFVVLIILGLCLCGCCVACIWGHVSSSSEDEEGKSSVNRFGDVITTGSILQEFHSKMHAFVGNHQGLPEQLTLTGQYNERRGNGEEESGTCSYAVYFSQNGNLTGSGLDEQDKVFIEGKLDVNTGDVVWKENTGDGESTSVMWGLCAVEGDKLDLRLSFKSDYLGTEGEMQLSGQLQGFESNVRKGLWSEGDARGPSAYKPVVVGTIVGTVVGAPVSGKQNESNERKVSTFNNKQIESNESNERKVSISNNKEA